MEEHGEVAGDVLAHFGDNLEDARKALEENYNGCYTSLADYAEELTTQASEVPKHLPSISITKRWGVTWSLAGMFLPLRRDIKKYTYFGAIRLQFACLVVIGFSHS